MPHHALVLHVVEDQRVRDVIVPDVVVDGLEMPHELARVDVQGKDVLGEQLRARQSLEARVRDRVADTDVDEVERRIDDRGVPHRPAARVRLVLGPRVVAELARLQRDRVERPDHLAGLGVDGEHPAGCAAVTTGLADQDSAIVVEGRGAEEVRPLPVAERLLPDDPAGGRVESRDRGIAVPDVDLAVADCDAAARNPVDACEGAIEALRCLGHVDPQPLTGGGVECPDVVVRVRHVDRVVVDDRGLLRQETEGACLELQSGDGQAGPKCDLQLVDVARVDLVQCRETLVPGVSVVTDPVVTGKRGAFARGERGRRRNLAGPVRCGDGENYEKARDRQAREH